MISGALLALAIMLTIWFYLGQEAGAAVIGGTLLNMAVFGAMCSYIAQAASFIILRRQHPHIERPYRSPLGEFGALLTIIIALVTIGFQFADPVYRQGVIGVAVWFAVGIIYFALFGRHRLVLSPEEEFALTKGAAEYKTH
jgi:ethanolamine permease